jgi:hypothetical protein
MKYFRTFSYKSIGRQTERINGMTPIDEISLEQAKTLNTYYEATYEGGRLVKFRKLLLQHNPDNLAWIEAWSSM